MIRRRNKELDKLIIQSLKNKIGTSNDIATQIEADKRTIERRLRFLLFKNKVEYYLGLRCRLYGLAWRKKHVYCWRCGEKIELKNR